MDSEIAVSLSSFSLSISYPLSSCNSVGGVGRQTNNCQRLPMVPSILARFFLFFFLLLLFFLHFLKRAMRFAYFSYIYERKNL